MELKVIKNLLKDLLKLTMVCSLLTGCAEIATNMAVQGAVQYAGDQMLIANNKPVTRCNMFNVIQDKKMCRIYRQYRRT